MGEDESDRNEPCLSGKGGLNSMVAASAVLMVGSAVLWGREHFAGRARQESFEAVKLAASRLDGAAGENAVKQFRSNIPLLGNDHRLAVIEMMEREFPLWPNLRKRNETYDQLRDALGRSDEGAATKAAEAFLLIGPGEKDTRRDQVSGVLAELRERASRHARDDAYTRLIQTRKKDQYLLSLLAAEQFLEAAPPQARDPRTKQVVDWYNESFSRWFVRQSGAIDAQAKTRIDRYLKLAPTL